jgi:glycosyltransferase involved in cell wall biosynthesis
MRILFVNPVGQIGGAERVLLDCIASIRQAEPEHQMHLMLMDDGPLDAEARKLGANVTILPAPRAIQELGDSSVKGSHGFAKVRLILSMILVAPRMWSYARRMRGAIQQIAPDVIHSNGLKPHLLLSQAKVKVPVVWHIHDFVGSRPMMAKLLRRFSCNATPVAISTAVADDIRRWLPGSAPVVVLNGIDIDRFSPGPGDGARLDELAELPAAEDGTVRVGLVATYARWKGQDLFLRAATEVSRDSRTVPLRFYIVGGPIYSTKGSQFTRDELAEMVRELGLAGRVGLVPYQQDAVAVYLALDVVVHASSQPEPFGLTIAEAMACGRAVVVSGAAELVRDGVDAISVSIGDVHAIGRGIRELVEVPARRAGLGSEARGVAVVRFDRRRMGRELLVIYRTIVKTV